MSDTIQVVSWSLSSDVAGQLYLPHGRERPNDVLWESINRTGVEARLRTAFQITDPIWYGLWIESPLSLNQCDLLHTVFSDAFAVVPRYAKYLQEFLAALQEAGKTDKLMTVKLSPPGHVDLGWITTFVHCPRCKAEGPFERWQESYPAASIECPICGYSYSPAETHSSEREHYAALATCSACAASFRVKDLLEEQIAILEDQHSYREACAEMTWLQRVAAFYQRHPDQDGQIEPHFMMIFESEDDRVKDDLMAGVPFDEIALPADGTASLAASRDWSAEDREVIEYLQQNLFSLSGQLEFIAERIKTLGPVVQARSVPCSKCGGKLQ